MAWFRRKSAQVIRKGAENGQVEERVTRRHGRDVVEVRRVKEQPKPSPQPKKQSERKPQRAQTTRQRTDTRSRKHPRHLEEVILPPETAKKQMLVRVLPHQTQIVVLEGPTLVEHHVAREDGRSLAQNI